MLTLTLLYCWLWRSERGLASLCRLFTDGGKDGSGKSRQREGAANGASETQGAPEVAGDVQSIASALGFFVDGGEEREGYNEVQSENTAASSAEAGFFSSAFNLFGGGGGGGAKGGAASRTDSAAVRGDKNAEDGDISGEGAAGSVGSVLDSAWSVLGTHSFFGGNASGEGTPGVLSKRDYTHSSRLRLVVETRPRRRDTASSHPM